MKVAGTRLVTSIFVGLFFISGFGKFDADYLYSPIVYEFPIDGIIEYSLSITAILLLVFFSQVIFFSPKIVKILSWQKLKYIAPIVMFNMFLSVKMLLYGNEFWYRNLFGAMVVLFIFSVFSQYSKRPNFFDGCRSSFDLIISSWILVVLFMFWQGGYSSIAWLNRFFFFSAHMNHAGALWATAAVFLFSGLLVGASSEKIKVIWRVCMLVIAIVFLFMTGSRGSMIAALAGALVALRYTKIKISVFLGVGLTLFISLAYLPEELLFIGLSDQIERGNTRSEVYSAAFSDFLNNPITGVPMPTGRSIYVENTALTFLQLGGLIGGVFCVIFYLQIAQLWSKSVKTKKLPQGGVVMLALLTYAMVASVFEAFPLTFTTTGIFSLLFSISSLSTPHD